MKTMWLMNVVREFEQAEQAGRSVREVYPNAYITLVTDGNDDPRWKGVASRLDAQLYYGERLYGVESGGAVVNRLLHLFLLPGRMGIGFKIDPDTRVHRPFTGLPLPHHPTLFGCPIGEPGGRSALQGGCIGWTRSAAETLFRSRLLLSPLLKDFRTWAGQSPESLYRGEVLKLTSFDWTLGWAATQLGIEMVRHREIGSKWHPPAPDNFDLAYAVTHPHK